MIGRLNGLPDAASTLPCRPKRVIGKAQHLEASSLETSGAQGASVMKSVETSFRSCSFPRGWSWGSGCAHIDCDASHRPPGFRTDLAHSFGRDAMKTRVERVSLSITPLAPLHLGCGTDFDPTEYVILDGLLYKFDPSRIPLTDTERREIVAAANLGGAKALIRIQAFFHAKAKACMGNATLAIPVSKGLESQYQSRIGRVAQYEPDREFVNRLVIERTAHHPHTGIPYLPGSGIKGAMRTAWLNRLNGGRIRPEGKRWQELQTELLGGGKFETDPFRLISISDASGSQVISRVVFHTNHRKTPSVGPDGLPRLAKGLAVRREGIVHGQLGSMQCEIGIDSLQGRDGPGTPSVSIRLRDWADLAKACNDITDCP